VSAVKSLLHRARVTLAHGASLPAFAVPLLARLPRLRLGQVFGGLVAEQTSGAAAIATLAIASTSALGSLHVPDPPTGPTAAQSRSALVSAARRPRVSARVPQAKRKDPLEAEYGPAASGAVDYGP